MDALSPTPRWPYYERRCREWTEVLRRLEGEFRRDSSGDRHLGWMAGSYGALGAWLLWAGTIGPDAPHEIPYVWLFPVMALVLLGLAALIVRRFFGVRYRFLQGEVCAIAPSGRIRWQEPLVTLQTVTFPWRARSFPPMLELHWTTHRRTIELYPSLCTAVGEALRSGRATPSEPVEHTWRCRTCREGNPDGFEVCWQCGTSAAP